MPGDVALSLSWNKSRFDPPSMAVAGNGVKVSRGGAHSRVVQAGLPLITGWWALQVWQYDDVGRKWDPTCVLAPMTTGVHDVSWAPKMGR